LVNIIGVNLLPYPSPIDLCSTYIFSSLIASTFSFTLTGLPYTLTGLPYTLTDLLLYSLIHSLKIMFVILPSFRLLSKLLVTTSYTNNYQLGIIYIKWYCSRIWLALHNTVVFIYSKASVSSCNDRLRLPKSWTIYFTKYLYSYLEPTGFGFAPSCSSY
jgi:hypothetical protein